MFTLWHNGVSRRTERSCWVARRLRTTQSRLDDLEVADVGQEVANRLVGIGPEMGALEITDMI